MPALGELLKTAHAAANAAGNGATTSLDSSLMKHQENTKKCFHLRAGLASMRRILLLLLLLLLFLCIAGLGHESECKSGATLESGGGRRMGAAAAGAECRVSSGGSGISTIDDDQPPSPTGLSSIWNRQQEICGTAALAHLTQRFSA